MSEMQVARLSLFLLAVCCLGSFSWARRWFFVRQPRTSPGRRGLGPLGSMFGLVSLLLLAVSEQIAADYTALLAGALFAASLALFWSAIRAFKELRPAIAFTPGAPTTLVSTGPYKHIRHPFYTAYMLYWIAALVAVPGVLPTIAVVIMGWLYWRAATEEESQILNSSLGDRYRAYRLRAGMFFPLVFRRRVR